MNRGESTIAVDTATELPTQIMAAAARAAPERRVGMPLTLRQTWPMRQGQGSRFEPDQALGADFLQLDPAKPEHKEIMDLQRATRFVPTKPANYDGIESAARAAGLLK